MIAKMHPLIIPPFTNKKLCRAVKDYVAGGARKKGIVRKNLEISVRVKKNSRHATVVNSTGH